MANFFSPRVIYVVFSLWFLNVPCLASRTTPLGHEEVTAAGLFNTRALVIAKLLRRVQERDQAYLAFENVQVVRGEPLPRILVFNHPEIFMPTWPSWYRVSQSDLDVLREGDAYLLVLTGGVSLELGRWVRLSDVHDTTTVEQQVRPYLELDDYIKRDPWESVAPLVDPFSAGSRQTLFVAACALVYYQGYASELQVKTILETYVAKTDVTWGQYMLTWRALRRAQGAAFKLSPHLLKEVYQKNSSGTMGHGIPIMICALALSMLAEAEGRDYEELIVDATVNSDRDIRIAALSILSKRRMRESIGRIRRSLEIIPAEDSYDRDLATHALKFQVSGRQPSRDNSRGAVAKLDRRKARSQFVERRLGNGAGFVAAAESLIHSHSGDPSAGDLFLLYVNDKHFQRWAMEYLALVAREKYRATFESNIDSTHPEVRMYAIAGLARLGDVSAQIKLVKLLAWSPSGMTRYYASKAYTRDEIADAIRLIAAEPYDAQDVIETALHNFLLSQLKAVESRGELRTLPPNKQESWYGAAILGLLAFIGVAVGIYAWNRTRLRPCSRS